MSDITICPKFFIVQGKSVEKNAVLPFLNMILSQFTIYRPLTCIHTWFVKTLISNILFMNFFKKRKHLLHKMIHFSRIFKGTLPNRVLRTVFNKMKSWIRSTKTGKREVRRKNAEEKLVRAVFLPTTELGLS